MEDISCPICDSVNFSNYISIKDRVFNENSFNLVKCKCDLIYINPRPTLDELSKYYSSNYFPHKKSKSYFDKIYSFVQKITFYWKKSIINKYSSKGTIIDIGSGKGEFVEYMNQSGWKAYPNDPYYQKSENTNIKADIITMWHSLEHVHNLNLLFSNIDKKIKSNTILYIAVPNILAYERSYFKKNWIAYDPPRHLYHFSKETMILLLKKYNFKIIKTKTMYQDTIFNIIFSSKNLNPLIILKGFFIIIKSLICITINQEKASSILYICKK